MTGMMDVNLFLIEFSVGILSKNKIKSLWAIIIIKPTLVYLKMYATHSGVITTESSLYICGEIKISGWLRIFIEGRIKVKTAKIFLKG